MTAKVPVFSLSFTVTVLAVASFAMPNARAATLTDAKISEFVADNNNGIVDEDGDREDWIEIWNTSGVAGDLGGWYLTDDPNNRTKWMLPAIEMTSGGYLVVFASGKNRADVAGEPHANFRLAREAGGYLALVKPDGVTIASEFANYPKQFEDIAYGVGIEGEVPVTFFAAGAQAKWHVPAGPVAGWTETDFDDSAWNAGATGIGYDIGGSNDYGHLFGEGGNVQAEMRAINATVYIRIPFDVPDPAGISNLMLRMKWEDGFIAHLNGTEFHREGAPAVPAWNSSAATGNRNETAAVTFFEFPVDQGGLVQGNNVLAIQGLNNSSGSSDVLFVPELAGIFQDTNNLVAGYFPGPTPGEENGIRYDGIVGDTSFSVDRGFYDTNLNLDITSSTKDAEIRYTTDGTPPSETTGQIYTGPISITGTTVVRAMAHKTGFRSTNIDTHTFIFPADVYGPQLVDSLTAVPTISIVAQANYDLRLMSVATTGDLPSQSNDPPEKSVVVVALVGGDLHIRIIDVTIRRTQETNRIDRQIVVDKPETQLVSGQNLTDLKNLLNQVPLPDASALSPEEIREIVDKAISISEHTPRIPFLEDSNNNYIEQKSSIEMIFPDGTPGFQEEGGLTNFGGGFTNFEKKSFRVYFRGEYGATKLRYPIFDGFDYENFPPVEEFDAINLRSGSHDMSSRGAYMSARFVDDSMLEMGQIAPHGRYVHVYLNGEYWGQYHLRERWNAEMGGSYFGGSKEDYDAISANNSGMEFQTGTPYDGTAAFWTETRSLLQGPDPFVNAAGHIDIPNVIDFMLLWTSGECESEFRAFGSQSRGVPFKFMIRDPDGFMPNGGWSHDHAVTHNGPLSSMTELRTSGNPDYDILLADRIHKHFFNDGALTAEKSVERLRKRFEEMRPGFEAEARRWSYQTVNSWEAYVNGWLNNGLPQRATSMLQRLRQAGMYPDIIAPVLSQHGGSIAPGAGVTMSTNATAIYYTLDGSDPRLPGGAISPAATLAPFSNNVRDPEDFVVSGDIWKYLDDGSDQGTAWREPGFDDSTWASGPSELGYGESEATTVSFGPNIAEKYATTYFRHQVEISNPAEFSWFVIKLQYDDGAAVYVNGIESVRTPNLPANATFDTYTGQSTPNENTFFEFIVPSSHFVNGVNTIAVELHQSAPTNSDISFDLILRGEIDTSSGDNITEPVILTNRGQLNARSYNTSTSEWSALTSTFFTIDTVPASADNLAISEIHYHPAEPVLPGEIAISTDRDDYEFIELLNTGTQPIDLSGVHFNDGITFSFADNTVLDNGSRLVLVYSIAAFTERYGAIAASAIAGQYSGRLSNDGERVTLSKTGIGALHDFVYNDQAPWPMLADGHGYSMVLVDAINNPDHAIPTNWLPNAMIGGSPGEADNALMTTYAAWRSDNNIVDDSSDNDGDRITAFGEYGFGSDPAKPDTRAFPRAAVVRQAGTDYLAITFEKNLLATDVVFQIQESTDLSSWTDATDAVIVSETVNPANRTSTITYRSATPSTQGNKQYLRLKLSLME